MVAMLRMPNPFLNSEADGAERRVFPRKEIHARIDGMRHDNTLEALRQPHSASHCEISRWAG